VKLFWACSLGLCLAFQGGTAAGAERWVDDDGVLAKGQIRLQAGLGYGLLSDGRSDGGSVHYTSGHGVNLEGASGLGAGVEIGVRLGHRLSFPTRGIRGDEIARLDDTETYGTGLDIFPSPELRIRFRAYQWVWGEAGLENRFVPPIESDRATAEVIGAWAWLHLWGRARLDFAFNGVFVWHSFAGGTVLQPGFSTPARFWVNLTQRLHTGLMVTYRQSAGTAFTSAHTDVLTGLVIGYRLERCDLIEVTSSRHVTEGVLFGVGIGLGLVCRL
jgi:hypothetical protein